MKPKKVDSSGQPLRRFRNEIDGMFQRFFDEPVLSNMPFMNNDITPACNIVEKKDRYSIEVEIPGINPEEIDIEVDNHILKIKGERTQEAEHKDEETEVHTVEHHYGAFSRAFTLPEGINDDQISAHDQNGILYIDIPKSQETKARRIKINKSDD